MEHLKKLSDIIYKHNDDFTTIELIDIAICIWEISLAIGNNQPE